MIDLENLEELVAAAAEGDERAWQGLWITLEPVLERMIARGRFLGRLGTREDDRRNIVVAIMARLRANDGARLRGYVEARSTSPDLAFLGWLSVVAKRVGIDYLRAHPEYLRRSTDAPDRWVEVEELPPASRIGGERPPVTMQNTARRVMEEASASSAPASSTR